MGKIKND